MKILIGIFCVSALSLLILACSDPPRARILEVRTELDSALKLTARPSGAAFGGTIGDDTIETDREYAMWTIPSAESDPESLFERLKSELPDILSEEGAEVVSSSHGVGGGFIPESQEEGAYTSTHSIVYFYGGGTGFIDCFFVRCQSTKESARIGMNHIFIPKLSR
ncbi:hypothetical protein [Sulfuriroseicoccus oceanibius]|uniref:Lipoprotein n=1 Tax=Sulfuriroseicoccus oceanibius TaxID=2707525 RepID=A0A6B3LFU3_9BACT|nr:hypothetical protein [Sulfuriroseicoccus oceanibius]QQL44616.1 hypothetical protein G3M56_012095 [Sulfuriroseicoccus oceanibius]